MYGSFAVVRWILSLFGILLLGMIIGGDAHGAGRIVGGIFGLISHHFLITLIAVVCTAFGLLIGGDMALTRLGEFEKHQRWERIRKG